MLLASRPVMAVRNLPVWRKIGSLPVCMKMRPCVQRFSHSLAVCCMKLPKPELFFALQGAFTPFMFFITLVMSFSASLKFELSLALGLVAGTWNLLLAVDLVVSQACDVPYIWYTWFKAVSPVVNLVLGFSFSFVAIGALAPEWSVPNFFALMVFAMMAVNGCLAGLLSGFRVSSAAFEMPAPSIAPPELPGLDSLETPSEERPRVSLVLPKEEARTGKVSTAWVDPDEDKETEAGTGKSSPDLSREPSKVAPALAPVSVTELAGSGVANPTSLDDAPAPERACC